MFLKEIVHNKVLNEGESGSELALALKSNIVIPKKKAQVPTACRATNPPQTAPFSMGTPNQMEQAANTDPKLAIKWDAQAGMPHT